MIIAATITHAHLKDIELPQYSNRQVISLSPSGERGLSLQLLKDRFRDAV
jgi:hypothetical protein